MPLPNRDAVLDRLDTGEERLLVSVMYQAETDMAKAHHVLDGLDLDEIESPAHAWRVLGAAALHDECARFFTSKLSALSAICHLVGMDMPAVRRCILPVATTEPDAKVAALHAHAWLRERGQFDGLRSDPARREILQRAREQWPHDLR